MNDPIRGQILVTDSMLTVTRPRQVVVHKIAETYLFGEDFKRGFKGTIQIHADFDAQNTGVLLRKKRSDCLS